METQQASQKALSTEFLMEIRVDLDLQIIGDTPAGHRRLYPIKGGWFKGPQLQGTVLPGGSDSFLVRPDGTGILDVRLTLKTDDDSLIFITYQGLLYHTPSLETKLMSGEAVDWSAYYFRIAPFCETASEKYGWLNRTLSIGVGEVDPNGVSYSVYQIK